MRLGSKEQVINQYDINPEGIWLHHTSDCQKYFVLQASPGLITDGLWSHSRNPNYLGELFILGSFAGVQHSTVTSLPVSHFFRLWLEPASMVVVLADAGGHPGGQHGARYHGQGAVPGQVGSDTNTTHSGSMSIDRYPGWCDYTSKSGLIFPNFFS